MKSITTVTKSGTHLEQLETLAATLAKAIKNCEDDRNLSGLAKQYRETVREIDMIKGGNDNDDEIGEILTLRAIDGKPGAVRKTVS